MCVKASAAADESEAVALAAEFHAVLTPKVPMAELRNVVDGWKTVTLIGRCTPQAHAKADARRGLS